MQLLSHCRLPSKPDWNSIDIAEVLEVLQAQILFGVIQDGGGYTVVGHRPKPIDSWGPLILLSREKRDIALSLAMDELASKITDTKLSLELRKMLYKSIETCSIKLQNKLNNVFIDFAKNKVPVVEVRVKFLINLPRPFLVVIFNYEHIKTKSAA